MAPTRSTTLRLPNAVFLVRLNNNEIQDNKCYIKNSLNAVTLLSPTFAVAYIDFTVFLSSI